jgi:hypothetical protein
MSDDVDWEFAGPDDAKAEIRGRGVSAERCGRRSSRSDRVGNHGDRASGRERVAGGAQQSIGRRDAGRLTGGGPLKAGRRPRK